MRPPWGGGGGATGGPDLPAEAAPCSPPEEASGGWGLLHLSWKVSFFFDGKRSFELLMRD